MQPGHPFPLRISCSTFDCGKALPLQAPSFLCDSHLSVGFFGSSLFFHFKALPFHSVLSISIPFEVSSFRFKLPLSVSRHFRFNPLLNVSILFRSKPLFPFQTSFDIRVKCLLSAVSGLFFKSLQGKPVKSSLGFKPVLFQVSSFHV